ncbi:endonuclease-reverse transcriptase [Elysia marginata]|uniref:Endonuclease-reverse transcriptase n=1 Tax=Elysia marginata TaxID=1093978 RepID=A0AAV4I2I1_9GAST|nr:endonuclease-reverse transcriptase [Elysia marginata]
MQAVGGLGVMSRGPHARLCQIIEAVSPVKPGKSPGIDNITGELVQAGGEATTDMLLFICNKILQTGVWPKPWTQSQVITLPKKGNLKLCQNYRTISLIGHPSKVMLKVILNRLRLKRSLRRNKLASDQVAGPLNKFVLLEYSWKISSTNMSFIMSS